MKYSKLPNLAKLALAIILAPVLGDIVVVIAYSGFTHDMWEMFGLGVLFAYPTTLLLGLPFHLALRHFEYQHYVFYLLGGFVIGTVVLMVMFSVFGLVPFVFIYGGIPGGIIAVIARWIVGEIAPVLQPRKSA